MSATQIFNMTANEIRSYGKQSCWYDHDNKKYYAPGWYYWCCFPGCLPEGDPIGPFRSYEEARRDAEENGFD
jgi:hypothetical protein